MMRRLGLLAILVFVAAPTAFIVWRNFPTTNCCDEGDKEYRSYDALVKRATSGNLDAIRQLHSAFKSSHREDEARMWALNGAIAGDANLADDYAVTYKSLPVEIRQADETVIRKNISSEGARRLAALIGLTQL